LSSREQHSDSFLLAALKNGNEEAFELLFNKYSGRLYHVAKQYVYDHDEILEIVQEVFFKVWANHSKIKPELPFVPYLARIAKNLLINQSKRQIIERSYLNSLSKEDYIENEQATGQTHYNEVSNIVDTVVESFPTKRQEVFLLSRKKGLSIKEISRELGISESTVENHINKALKVLRQQLQHAGYLESLLFFSFLFF
jgi:RNA polymerase sigma-70 factor (ECF subfamily)